MTGSSSRAATGGESACPAAAGRLLGMGRAGLPPQCSRAGRSSPFMRRRPASLTALGEAQGSVLLTDRRPRHSRRFLTGRRMKPRLVVVAQRSVLRPAAPAAIYRAPALSRGSRVAVSELNIDSTLGTGREDRPGEAGDATTEGGVVGKRDMAFKLLHGRAECRAPRSGCSSRRRTPRTRLMCRIRQVLFSSSL